MSESLMTKHNAGRLLPSLRAVARVVPRELCGNSAAANAQPPTPVVISSDGRVSSLLLCDEPTEF